MADTQQETLLREWQHKCISGSHILHHHSILDAYGHLSFRHPTNPDIFVMPQNMAPANISSPNDLVQYKVTDASAVQSGAPAGYIERYIHSEIYRKFPQVNSVIHSHASDVIPYSISGVPLRACIHMAAFLGASSPVYEISKYYQPDDVRDLLIRNTHLGESLASCFGRSQTSDTTDANIAGIEKSVVLMRGHGYTVAARSIEECVYRAIYTRENAAVQSASLGLLAAYQPGSIVPLEVEYIREDELPAAGRIAQTGWLRAWNLWLREVEDLSLYRHLN